MVRKKQLALVMIAAGTLLVLVLLYAWRKNANPPASNEPIITESTDTPDESTARAVSYRWAGMADDPKMIRIQKIGVKAYVQKLGIDRNRQVATPVNVHLAGWYKDSVAPGNKGLSIIVGHLTGRHGNGIFVDLSKLSAGDIIVIEKGNATEVSYRVIDTKTVPEEDAAAYLFSQQPDVAAQLNVITCAGAFDAKANKYPDRRIIQATLER